VHDTMERQHSSWRLSTGPGTQGTGCRLGGGPGSALEVNHTVGFVMYKVQRDRVSTGCQPSCLVCYAETGFQTVWFVMQRPGSKPSGLLCRDRVQHEM
jgi:hypothetical protein